MIERIPYIVWRILFETALRNTQYRVGAFHLRWQVLLFSSNETPIWSKSHERRKNDDPQPGR